MAEETVWTDGNLILTLADDASVYLKAVGSGQIIALIPSDLRVAKMREASEASREAKRKRRDRQELFEGLVAQMGFTLEACPAFHWLVAELAVQGDARMIALAEKLIPRASQKSNAEPDLEADTALRLLALLERRNANATPPENS